MSSNMSKKALAFAEKHGLVLGYWWDMKCYYLETEYGFEVVSRSGSGESAIAMMKAWLAIRPSNNHQPKENSNVSKT